MPRTGTDLNAIAAFVQVVDGKTFRAAARALGVPRSTVSLKVAQLEDHLGVRLLERTTRTVRLTEAGTAYYRQVSPALEALGDAEQTVTDLQAQPSGRLRITAPIESGQLLLGSVVAEYMRLYPDVRVDVDITNRRVDLIEEGFDLALRAGPMPDSSLIARKLGPPQRARLYASPAYLRKHRAPRRPEDLERHRLLAISTNPLTWTFHRRRGLVAVKVRPHVSSNSLFILRDLAAAGHGITRLPELMGADPLRSGALRTILDEFSPPPESLSAVYPSARNLSPKVRAFLEVLERGLVAWLDSQRP
jgi:DNA-binding transcriptional LysR family regulator